MNGQSALTRILLTPILFWVALLFAGGYYMISFDKTALQLPQQQAGFIGSCKHVFNAMRLTNINKGIDLAGGTHLVLSVEVEKAVENRLGIENKSLDQLFTAKGLTALPKTKVIKGEVITLQFDNEEAAKSCYNMILDNRAYVLKVQRSGSLIECQLVADVVKTIKKYLTKV